MTTNKIRPERGTLSFLTTTGCQRPHKWLRKYSSSFLIPAWNETRKKVRYNEKNKCFQYIRVSSNSAYSVSDCEFFTYLYTLNVCSVLFHHFCLAQQSHPRTRGQQNCQALLSPNVLCSPHGYIVPTFSCTCGASTFVLHASHAAILACPWGKQPSTTFNSQRHPPKSREGGADI